MEHEFWKWAQSHPKITKDIIEYALEMSGAANIRQGKHAQLWPSKRSEPIFEKGKRFFLDVGGWYCNHKGFAHTDFGLVSGNYVLVCSWLNMEGERRGLKFPQYCVKNNVRFTDRIRTFFDMPKGAIAAHFESPEPFVSDKDLIVFLPDFHLHLFRETVIDNFQYNRNFQTKNDKPPDIVSLEDELAELLKQAQGAEIVQVGDCFEVWEVQAHLVDDHQRLCNFLKEPSYKPHLSWIKGKPSLIDILDYMSRKRKMVPRKNYQFYMDDFNYVIGQFKTEAGFTMPLTFDQVDKLGVPIDDTYYDTSNPATQVEEIVYKTMTKYPKIFANAELKTNEQKMPFLWLRGNHDNMRANYWYEKYSYEHIKKWDYEFSCSPIFKRSCIFPETRKAYDIYKGGIDQCVWAEHGHRFDVANSDFVFDSLDQGYDVTRFFTLGRIIGESGWRSGAIELKVAEKIGERIFYYMRGEQLNLVYDIFNNEAEVRLIVMGHTHSHINRLGNLLKGSKTWSQELYRVAVICE